MRKKVAALGVLGFSLSVALCATCSTMTLYPGDSFCVQTTAESAVSATGTSDKNVHFTVSDCSVTTLFDEAGSTSFGGDWTSETNPGLFPGCFCACADRNPNKPTPAVVSLCIAGN